MSGHRSFLTIHFVFFSMCFLQVCISKTLNNGRQKRSTEDNVCLESKNTLEKVQKCPENDNTFDERSNKKKCDSYTSCTGEPLAYHCVRCGDSLVEVCAPITPITGRCCPVYNVILGRVIEDYNKRCYTCPFRYKSSERMNKTECVEPENQGQRQEKTTTTSTSKANVDVSPKQDTEHNIDAAVIISIVLGGITVLCICLAIAYRYRNCGSRDCPRRENGLKDNEKKKDSVNLQCNDLICNECSESMLKEDDCESYRPTCVS